MASYEERGMGLVASLDVAYDEAVRRVRSAFKDEGFGILTEIDVQSTLKQKIDADIPRYIILGACNPHIAHKAITATPEVGLLLPCNVLVYEEAGRVVVSALNPEKALAAIGDDNLKPFAEEASVRIRRAMEAVVRG